MKAQDKWINSASVTISKLSPFAGFLLLFFTNTAFAQPQCAPTGAVESAKVTYVHDGDTVWLADRDAVRLIGLNTPEIAYRDRVGEPLGEQARAALASKIQNQNVLLEFEEQKKDSYGRKLAHIHLPGGINLTAWMLEQGFAHTVAVPPNLRHQLCYQQAEQVAREHKRGVWAHTYYSPIAADEVRRGGFSRIYGCVQEVINNRRGLALKLADDMLISIRAANRDSYFKDWLTNIGNRLAKVCLLARGWVYNDGKNKQKILEIKHPNAIESYRFR